jgi:inner membrane transporter RhtA
VFSVGVPGRGAGEVPMATVRKSDLGQAGGTSGSGRADGAGDRLTAGLGRLPPQSFFLVSAVFHYLGPSLAVLLFARVSVLGVAWLRIVTAAAVFALWRRPWRLAARLDRRALAVLLALGAVLAAMNSLFYLAVARLPLATVGAIEFLGTVLLAALGARTWRNAGALALTTAGVAVITEIRAGGQPLGFVFAFANCALFMLYVVLGHRIANAGDGPGAAAGPVNGAGREAGEERRGGGAWPGGIDRLGASMLVAAVAVSPIGLGGALAAFSHPLLLLAGAGVGVCSSVIPYVTDQLAMARLPRATFALMLALLPVFATVIGAVVLGQIPSPAELAGIALVVAGVAVHRAG